MKVMLIFNVWLGYVGFIARIGTRISRRIIASNIYWFGTKSQTGCLIFWRYRAHG